MIQQTAVIGAGTMGHAIAGCFALYGYDVSVYESCEPVRNCCEERIKSQYEFFLEESMIEQKQIAQSLDRITVYGDLKSCVENADYVIEAIPEKLELKLELFAELDTYCKPGAIFASNTSSLALGDMTKNLSADRKARSMVCHWYNPAHIMPIVELSCFGNIRFRTLQR